MYSGADLGGGASNAHPPFLISLHATFCLVTKQALNMLTTKKNDDYFHRIGTNNKQTKGWVKEIRIEKTPEATVA